MKISTILLIILFALNGYSQKTTAFIDKTTTSISPNTSFSVEKIYPNPVIDEVNLDIYSEITEPIQISLYNILGTQVKKWDTKELKSGNQVLKINLSDIKSGVYILKISVSGKVCSQVIKKS